MRKLLMQSFARALAEVNLEVRVHDALPTQPPRRTRATVIAIGKAAPAMAAGAIARWPTYIDRA